MTPSVSIVVPSRGGVERIPRLLESLRAQTCQDFELIVVVDGDIDGTESYLKTQSTLRVQTIVLPRNRGRAGALNAGFSQATGQILTRCDDDLELPAHYIADQITWHKGTVGGAIGLCRNVYPPTAYSRAYGVPMDHLGRAAAYSAPAQETWRHWGANVSVPRKLFDEVGPYDVDYRGYGWEDADWGWRLHALGYPIEIRPELEALHYVASTTTAVRARRALYSGAARHTFTTKHGDTMLAGLASAPTGVWNRTVHLVAARLNEHRAQTASAIIDRVLPVMPAPLGRKLVALMVEASNIAGYRRPSSVGTAI
jgi:glycosyltransferase involved in cell wall biosynthesis